MRLRFGCDRFHGVARAAANGTRCCGSTSVRCWRSWPRRAFERTAALWAAPGGFADHMHRTRRYPASTFRSSQEPAPGRGDGDAAWAQLDISLAPMGKPWSRPGTAKATFHEGLHQSRLTRLMNEEAFARAFAVALFGQRVPPSAASSSLALAPGPAVRKIAPKTADDVPTIRLVWAEVVVLTQRYRQDRSSS